MVSFRQIVSVSATLSLTILSALANPTPAPLPASFKVANNLDLLKRASAPQFDLSQIPAQCQSVCKDANGKIAGCTSDACFCTDANLEPFGACLSCVVADPNSSSLLDKDTAQKSMDVLTGVCNNEGFKVKDVTIGASSGAARYTMSGFGALAGIAFGAFALA